MRNISLVTFSVVSFLFKSWQLPAIAYGHVVRWYGWAFSKLSVCWSQEKQNRQLWANCMGDYGNMLTGITDALLYKLSFGQIARNNRYGFWVASSGQGMPQVGHSNFVRFLGSENGSATNSGGPNQIADAGRQPHSGVDSRFCFSLLQRLNNTHGAWCKWGWVADFSRSPNLSMKVSFSAQCMLPFQWLCQGGLIPFWCLWINQMCSVLAFPGSDGWRSKLGPRP